jgi:IMP dehydrogenase
MKIEKNFSVESFIDFLKLKNLINLKDGSIEVTDYGNLFFQEPSLSFEDVIIIPKKNDIKSRSHVSLETNISKNYKIPSPLICANMECVINSDFAIKLWENNIAGAMHRFFKLEEDYIKELEKIAKSGALTIASCGVQEEQINLMEKCVEVGTNIIIVDVAHGYSESVRNAVIKLKEKFGKLNVDIIAGNFADGEAIEYLHDCIDGAKIGIGTGSICQTQIKTGSGNGPIGSIKSAYAAAKKYNIPLIYDGGISEPGDVLKALISGANSVMAGKIFARCPESAAEIVEKDGKEFKVYYGMASHVLKNKAYGNKKNHVASEGISAYIPLGASINEFAAEFLAAIKSGFTYSGSLNIEELQTKGELQRISKASYEKGTPHIKNYKDSKKISS